MFYVLIVELSSVLDGIGVTDTATVGLVSAIGSPATAVAAFLFPRLAKPGPAVTIPTAFAGPLLVLALAAATTGLSPALLMVGAAALLLALAVRVTRPASGDTSR